jgi:hypothetical protein
MSKFVALRNLEIDKENFESYMDFKYVLTNKQWAQIVDDLDGRASNYLDELLQNIAKDFEEGFYDE